MELAAFLDEVWKAQRQKPRTLLTYDEVYSIYNQVIPHPITHPSQSGFLRYVEELVELERNFPNECKCSVQDYDGWEFSELAEYAKNPKRSLPAGLLDNVRRICGGDTWAAFVNDFLKTFYHFVPRKQVACTQRVYLNVKGDEAVRVMKFVVPSIMPGLPGCYEAKIAGPKVAGERADTIVIYSQSETTTNAILERLTEYQRLPGNQARFDREIPKMAAPVRGLVGIAVGAEPKLAGLGSSAKRVLQPQESFGSMRSKLVREALRKRLQNLQNEEAFFAEVIRLFQSARLNPMAPHIN